MNIEALYSLVTQLCVKVDELLQRDRPLVDIKGVAQIMRCSERSAREQVARYPKLFPPVRDQRRCRRWHPDTINAGMDVLAGRN